MMTSQEDANNYFKQKRDEYLIDIRKKKNTAQIEAKRIKFSVECDQSDDKNNPYLKKYITLPLEDLCSAFVNFYKNDNLTELPLLSKAIRLSMSSSDNPPVGIIMNASIVPYFLNILKSPTYFDAALIQEISWIVINLVSSQESEYTNYLVGLDILPISMQLLDYDDQEVKENAIWILANITGGDSLVYRNDLFKRGIAQKIDELFSDRHLKPSIGESMIWLISNLCRGKPYPNFEEVTSFLVYIQDYIKNCTKDHVLVHCMYTLSYVTDTDDEVQIEEILDMDILDDLISKLKSKNPRMRKAIARTIGNITATSDENTEAIISKGFIEALYPLLSDEMIRTRKDACWCYSNILAGVTSQVRKVFDFEDGKIIEKLFHMAKEDDAIVSEECIFALVNAANTGTMREVGFLVDLGFIEMIVELLSKVRREEILTECLTALTAILEEGKQISFGPSPADNPYFNTLLECDGVCVLERLQNFPGEAVYQKVEKLLKDFVDKM